MSRQDLQPLKNVKSVKECPRSLWSHGTDCQRKVLRNGRCPITVDYRSDLKNTGMPRKLSELMRSRGAPPRYSTHSC
jgi:hypothetical protein